MKKRISENTKITLTIKQLKRLVKESKRQNELEDNVPVTDEEKAMCQYIEEEIRQRFNLQCGCQWHNPGEEMHIEVFVECPNDDTDIEQLCGDLENFVDKIGGAENDGEKWGDSSFQPLNEEEIFGEVWPLN